MAGHRSYITTCSEDVLQQILDYLSFEDKAHFSMTCKAFTNHFMAGRLEIRVAKQGLAQQRSVRKLIHLLEGMSAEQRCNIRELYMNSNSTAIAKLPDPQQHRICRALIGNLTILRLHDVYMCLEALEAPGIELRLEVLDLTGSFLVAEANAGVLVWPLLSSNSPTLRCLILRNVLVHVPKTGAGNRQDLKLEPVVLPVLEELDIVRFGELNSKPSGNKFFEQRRAGIRWAASCDFPLQNFKGAPNLTTLRFSPPCQVGRSAHIRVLPWEHFRNLRSVELSHEAWLRAPRFNRLPSGLSEITIWLWIPPHVDTWTGESDRFPEYFKLIMYAASAGMRLRKLTLVGFTYNDIRRFADGAQGLCLAGVRELILEPCLSEAVVVALEHIQHPHPVDQLLPSFPDLEKLQIRGQDLNSLTLTAPCPLLDELSLSFCPASIKVTCLSLRSLRLVHRFGINSAGRKAESHRLDMSAWCCGLLDSLSVELGSYRKGDVCHVHCKPGTTMTASLTYPADKWERWVIGLRLGVSKLGQSRRSAVRFVCTSSHGMLTWGVA